MSDKSFTSDVFRLNILVYLNDAKYNYDKKYANNVKIKIGVEIQECE